MRHTYSGKEQDYEIWLLIGGILIMLFVSLKCFGTDDVRAKRVLEENGLTSIQIKGFSWFGCLRGENYHTRFEALNLKGKKVTGIVCSGWFTNVSIRWD